MKIYIVSACRTPIGKMGGVFRTVPASELGAVVIKEAVNRAGLNPENVDHVFMGCVLQAGLGQNIARQAALKAGLPVETTAETLNLVCGSGLSAVNAAARMILCGEAEIVAAGGTENMSRAPFAVMNGRFGYHMGSPMIPSELVDTMVNDALWDAFGNIHMGTTAENIAAKWNLSREEIDAFALNSQCKAWEAEKKGAFKDEIVPVKVRAPKEDQVICADECPRGDTTMEALLRLKPAFKEDGVITAGNSSRIGDGAAAVILASERKVRELALPVLAEWGGGALAGVPPEFMGTGPIDATKKLLGRTKLGVNDIDIIETNEAFAAQSIVVQRELKLPEERVNINGGAIALGHPVGASGCRILVTLIYNMIRRNASVGLATLCIGGGMGCSTLIRRECVDYS